MVLKGLLQTCGWVKIILGGSISWTYIHFLQILYGFLKIIMIFIKKSVVFLKKLENYLKYNGSYSVYYADF